jgi:HEAT repeat protein
LAQCVADQDPRTRRNAIVALSRHGKSVGVRGIAAITEATKDPVQHIRREALAALPKIAGEEVVIPALIVGLKDDAPVVQVEAANQIGWLVFPKGAERTMPTRPERKYADKCVPALVVGLSHKDWTVRAACAAALGEFRAQAQSAIPTLEAALRDEAMQVRWAADSALKKIRKSLPAK